jgi:hypothetical protein
VNEPEPGHFDRFTGKLDAEFHQNKRNAMGPIWRYAAAIVLIASLAGVLMFQYANRAEQLTAQPANNELSQVMAYYDNLASQRLDNITSCAATDEEAEKIDRMAREQIEKLDKEANALKIKLEEDASNERVYGALVNNYRTRIKLLDNIIDKICQL